MTSEHLGQLQLRRLVAGELESEEGAPARQHAQTCEQCQAGLRAIEEEQRSFEREIPFERFEQGVRKSGRMLSKVAAMPWRPVAMALAAGVVLTVMAGPILSQVSWIGGRNRTKGGAEVVLRVGGAEGTPQRDASDKAPELLASGERVRIGYHAGGHPYVASLSIDERGEVTPLYPLQGQSLPTDQGSSTAYLPGSLEFTGQGTERIVVILSDEPLEVNELRQAADNAFERAGGRLADVPTLDLGVPAEQFHRLVLKPGGR
jgi:hypothetical protein